MRNPDLIELRDKREYSLKHGFGNMVDAFGPDHDWYFFRPLLQEMMNKTMIEPNEFAKKAIARANLLLDMGIVYKLGAGGRNPRNTNPSTFRDGVYGCDCAGAVAWMWEFDRFQDPQLWFRKRSGQFNPPVAGDKDLEKYFGQSYNAFDYYGGWINTDSMLEDAFDNNADWFIHLDKPIPGAIICYGSVGKGKDKRIGHEGLVVEAPIIFDREDPESWKKLKVIDCRSAKPAVAVRDGMTWFGKDRKGRPKQSQFIWPVFVGGTPEL